jgi:peptidoglycan/LPS O-acetylase OafA/YrhL
LRWPTLHWQLAAEQAQAAPMVREGIAALFATSNLYLGNVIGEFFGELFLNLFFAFAAFVLARAAARIDRPQHWLLLTGLAASLIGGVAMLRNLTAVVEPIAAANNIVLPLWMLVMGVAMVRQGRAKAVPHIQSLADPVAMPLPEPAKSKRWPRAKSVLVL